MRVTILDAGRPPESLRAAWPSYADMFIKRLSRLDTHLQFDVVDAVGETLPDPETLDAVLITGSAAGVYEDADWIRQLLRYIGWLAEVRVPSLGICFGHQAIAQALGGQVEKSEKGWGIGRHDYCLNIRPKWFADKRETFGIAVSHQDQVTVPPPGAEVLASSDFTPYAGLLYAQGPMISFQGHPEFEVEFAAALYETRKGARIAKDQVERAIETLRIRLDNDFVLQSALNFLHANRREHVVRA